MSGTDAIRKSPRPRIELLSPARSAGEAAAIVAAIEQFLAETVPAPVAAASSRWQRAALEEGISARQLSGAAWGHAAR